MAEEKLVKAVQEIAHCTQQAVILDAAKVALKTGDNEALIRLLILAREKSNTAVPIEIANKALGFKE